jgi:hypothetical protein
VHGLMAGLMEKLHVPDIELSIVLTGDITASIRQRGEESFRPQRIGGQVTGKRWHWSGTTHA